LWVAVVFVLFLWHLGEAAWSSWTPFVTVLPVAAFLVAAWSLACVDRWALPVVVFTGSFVTQTHIGYVPLVVSVGATALIVSVVRHQPRRENLPSWRFPVAIAVGLFVLVWVPPTIDALVHHPSNLDQLRAFPEDYRAQETHTLGDGWIVATRGLSGFLEGRADLTAKE